ncbi:hypothetical protein [Nonomuraea endophytica]|uniref:Uncharacterized protein n=1 Tax=Nonomuraea endophytica TaxID=714136 RepID=A0A7W8EJW9_9ACTN|nr:hypothetical protein [Nonomuraea endophytica]MBB5083605.1 hypothetical protein [Nonomuraea endophytica]
MAEHADPRLEALLDALDADLPFVRYRIRRFPQGPRCAVLSVHESTRILVFVQDRQWVCVTETTAGRVSRQTLGTVEEAPKIIVSRIPLLHVGRPAQGRAVRLARALGLGFAAAIGAGVLAAALMAILVLGNGYGYGSDAVRTSINILALVIGAAVGAWVARRSWRAGRTRRDGSRRPPT